MITEREWHNLKTGDVIYIVHDVDIGIRELKVYHASKSGINGGNRVEFNRGLCQTEGYGFVKNKSNFFIKKIDAINYHIINMKNKIAELNDEINELKKLEQENG